MHIDRQVKSTETTWHSLKTKLFYWFCQSWFSMAYLFHTCPILSTRFQWKKPGVQRSLVIKWNRKSIWVNGSLVIRWNQKCKSSWVNGSLVIRWNWKCKEYFEIRWKGGKAVRWGPLDPLETLRFRWNLWKSSRDNMTSILHVSWLVLERLVMTSILQVP